MILFIIVIIIFFNRLKNFLFNLNNIQPTPQNNEEMSLYTKADFENLGNRKYFNRENKNNY